MTRHMTETERLMVKCAQSGDQRCIDKVVDRYGSLVTAIVKNIDDSNLHCEKMDLFQCGVIGLITAIGRYEHDRDASFPTYATWWIRKFVMREIYRNTSILYIPVNEVQRHRRGVSTEETAALVNDAQNSISYDEAAAWAEE